MNNKKITNLINKSIAILLVTAIGIIGMNKPGLSDMVVKAYSVTPEEVEWNVQALQASDAYEDSRMAADIKVAVLDSGLDYDPDIPYVERKDFLGEDEESLHPLFQDYTGHGTSVASLICAQKNDSNVRGMAANAKLYIARILDKNNDAPISRVVEAIDWAIEKDVKIIHMSFGTTGDYEELHNAVKRACEKGILLIAAAGNRGTAEEDESTVEYPAAYDEVLAVGATGTDAMKTETSSSGTELDVVAPGDQILSTGAFGGISVQEGTSMAAAQVTGIAAALWGQHPDKSGEFIKGLLIGTANRSSGSLKDCGNGQVDYQEAKTDFHEYNEEYSTQKQLGNSEKMAIQRASRSLDENRKDIQKYSNVKYVNGSWGGKKHDEAVPYYLLTEKEIDIVKMGAVQPDHIQGMTNNNNEHPCFHGYGNYFANTQYMVEVAKAYYYNKKNKYPKYSTVFKSYNPYTKLRTTSTKTDKYDIREWVKSADNEIFSKFSLKDNKKKGLFFLGCSIHIATDTFSHRGYRWYSFEDDSAEGWEPIQHRKETNPTHISYYWSQMMNLYSGDMSSYLYGRYSTLYNMFAIADKAELLPNRYNTAKQVVLQIIADFKGNKNKSLNPLAAFNTGIKAIYPEQSLPEFRLENAVKYMKEIRKKTTYPFIKKLSIAEKNNAKEVEGVHFAFKENGNKLVQMSFKAKTGRDYIVVGKRGKKQILLYHGRALKNKIYVNFLVKKASGKDSAAIQACKDKQVNVNWFCIKEINLSEVRNTIAKMKCTIRYEKSGKSITGEMKKQDVKYSFKGAPALRKNKFAKKGYKFAGWSLDKKNVRYKNGAKYKFDKFGTVTLYPLFQKKAKKKTKKAAKKSKK